MSPEVLQVCGITIIKVIEHYNNGEEYSLIARGIKEQLN
jgi:hypothetical protein